MADYLPEQIWTDRARIREVQSERLVRLLRVVNASNPFWQRRFTESGVDVASVQCVDDLQRLPVIDKQQLVDDQASHPPYGTDLTNPLVNYSRLHQTSGTRGAPLRWLDTPENWAWFLECWRQKFTMVGLRHNDRLLFPFSFGPFIGFWAAFEGANRLGNLCIATGGLSSEARLRLIEENSATLLCCTPTYALRLAEVAAQSGIDLVHGPVRMLIVAGEPGGSIPSIRGQIEAAWGARVIDHWGMTEVGSLATEHMDDPGGLMVLETECIAEIVSPESLQPVQAGDVGELLLTNLGRLGSPLIRYRTGDLVKAATRPSSTGLQLMRLDGGVLSRADDMLTIRGNNVFPSCIEAVIREFNEAAEFRIEVFTEHSMPQLRVLIEPVPTVTDLDAFLATLARTFKDRFSFRPQLVAVDPGTLPRFEMKGRRFHRSAE